MRIGLEVSCGVIYDLLLKDELTPLNGKDRWNTKSTGRQTVVAVNLGVRLVALSGRPRIVCGVRNRNRFGDYFRHDNLCVGRDAKIRVAAEIFQNGKVTNEVEKQQKRRKS